jgi:hypothetical protein
VTCDRERLVGLGAEAVADERGDGFSGERPGSERGRERIGGDLREQRRVGTSLRGTKRRDDEHRESLETPHEVGEETQRRLVAPVQVVDGEEQRPL